MFWLTRSANICFFLGLLWALKQLSGLDHAESTVRLTYAFMEEHREFISSGLLFAWMIPALVYAAQWPSSFWLLNSREAAPSRLCWFYSFGLTGAGIYLLTRLNVLILNQETAWYWLELIGAVTALLAAVSAYTVPVPSTSPLPRCRSGALPVPPTLCSSGGSRTRSGSMRAQRASPLLEADWLVFRSTSTGTSRAALA